MSFFSTKLNQIHCLNKCCRILTKHKQRLNKFSFKNVNSSVSGAFQKFAMSETSPQLVQITPRNALLFKGPFDTPSKTYMKIMNVSNKKVLFKVKTTMSKCYSVRPNRGILEPSCKTNIVVCLKAFTYEPENKCRHKFMLQSTTICSEIDENNLKEAWKNIPQDQIVEYKLKCVFDCDNCKEE